MRAIRAEVAIGDDRVQFLEAGGPNEGLGRELVAGSDDDVAPGHGDRLALTLVVGVGRGDDVELTVALDVATLLLVIAGAINTLMAAMRDETKVRVGLKL